MKGYTDMTTDVKFPEITVQLTGSDGNAFAIAGTVRMAMKRAGVPEYDCKVFFNEALSGDYDHVLQTCMKTVNVE